MPVILAPQTKALVESLRLWLLGQNESSTTGTEVAEALGFENPSSSDYRLISSLMVEDMGWSSKRVAKGTIYTRPPDWWAKNNPAPAMGPGLQVDATHGTPEQTAQENVIQNLEVLLQAAKEGKVQAILGVGRGTDGSSFRLGFGMSQFLEGSTSASETWEMVGRLEELKQALTTGRWGSFRT